MRKAFRFYAKDNHVGFTVYGSRIDIEPSGSGNDDTWFWVYGQEPIQRIVIFGASSAVINRVMEHTTVLWEATVAELAV